ncbi:MAG: hypothetical protein ABI461_04170, partial [Polyangiaceae bacterium]
YPLIMALIRARDPDSARSLVRTTLDEVDRGWRARHLPTLARTPKKPAKSAKPAPPAKEENFMKSDQKASPKVMAATKTKRGAKR